jgi:hypothetical protein
MNRTSRPGFGRLLAMTTVALSIFASSLAQADIFRLTYDETAIDPVETFDADCLGETPAEDCDVRSALIEAELVALLSRLEHDKDPATLALFQSALELDSPVVRAMAVRYLSRSEETPTDFLSMVKTFFFGPDAPLGVASAGVLEASEDESDQQLAELFGEQRPAFDYAPPPIREDETTEFESELLLACTQDARLELMLSFGEEEQFAPAERLLMYDRFVYSFFDPTQNYPVTTFLTEASVEDVSDFFSALFGEPHAPVADGEQRMQELNEQLIELQGRAASGDQDAIAAMQRVVEEMTVLQEALMLGNFLQLPAIHAENDLVFLDGTPEDLYTAPLRAVTVGADELLGGTVIRYINAPVGQRNPGSDGGSGGAPGDEEPSGEGGASDGGTGEGGASGDANDRPVRGSSDGCGCSVPRRTSPLAAFSMLPLLAWLMRRRRR